MKELNICKYCNNDLEGIRSNRCIKRNNKICKSCYNANTNKSNLEIKVKCFELYNSKCKCCGESIIEFLTIDHVNNDGAKHRKEDNSITGTKIYNQILKGILNKEDYQILCFNCNLSKFKYKCYHEYMQDL